VNAAIGTVTRNTEDLSTSLLVTLTSNDLTEATVPSTVLILAGQSSATFGLNAVDDTIMDGTQTVTITASRINYLPGTAVIFVTDNDTLPRPGVNSPGGMFTSARPTITWTGSEGATSYDIWIGNQTTGVNPYLLANTSGTSFQPDSDIQIGTYNLWIRARGETADSPWTTQVNFRVGAPVTMVPMDRWQSTNRPAFQWNALPGAVKYEVWISDLAEPSAPFLRLQDVTATSFTPDADMPLGLYRVWVRGIAADGMLAAWSMANEFFIAPAPQILNNHSSTFDRTPQLEWSSVTGAAAYEVFVRNMNNGQTVYNQTNITGTQWTPPADLAVGPYRWWVLGVSANGVRGLWSAPTDLYVGGRPILENPTPGAAGTSLTLNWQAVEGAQKYELWVTQLSTMTRVIYETELTQNSFVTASSMESGAYRMWVRAVSTSGEMSA
ncbi:MAG: hypothetical protein JNL58_32425, partial [Planctomyces sp.]|nr:hypothetical protein [Planctomyces sp.]